VRRWIDARTPLFAAALAFQALLAIGPALLMLLAVAGRFLGQERTQRSLFDAANRFVGHGADQMLTALLQFIEAGRPHAIGTIVGAALFVYSASSFFARLRDAFDAIWGVRSPGFGRAVLERLLSMAEAVVAAAAALFLLAAAALRTVVGPAVAQFGSAGAIMWIAWTYAATFMMTLGALTAAFHWIPSARPRPGWGAAAAGALPATMLLNLASHLFGLVVVRSTIASLYGAAASVIMFLLSVYYSAAIVLFGAEVCRAFEQGAGTPATHGAEAPGI
jgi:membrane protein